MSERTDEELIKIVTVDRNDYQHLAVIAAEEEIKNRSITTTTTEQVENIINTQEKTAATPWPRFFARNFDVWLEICGVCVVLGIASGLYPSSFVAWMFNTPGADKLFDLLCLPVALILDAAIYHFFGNTPGKAILGLKVETFDASPLSFGQYLVRNFKIWVKGLALGFPLINLFTMIYQAKRIWKGQQASYDESANYRVQAQPIGWVRKLSFAVIFFCLLAGMAALTKISGNL